MSEVSIQNISKSYGAAPVLSDVSLSVPDGSFTILLGPSGCGKSTILRLIAGLEKTEGGKVLIGDRDVTGLAPGERDVAMVFQNYALYPHLGNETIYSAATRLGVVTLRAENRWNSERRRVEIGILKERIMVFDEAGRRVKQKDLRQRLVAMLENSFRQEDFRLAV
ncbi:MAG: ATP-binding cassette domain-containing protein [Gracilibacteraceae bacterium]|jgi:ABC-type Fe3+/spermidine/putrescine transport system ATPase subunit|nr:ATP-binding cassette domain-containing protein [Gracilibacteraceae bacterium]